MTQSVGLWGGLFQSQKKSRKNINNDALFLNLFQSQNLQVVGFFCDEVSHKKIIKILWFAYGLNLFNDFTPSHHYALTITDKYLKKC